MKLAWFIVAIVYISSGNVRSANLPLYRPGCPENSQVSDKVRLLLNANQRKPFLAGYFSQITDKATAYNNIIATHDGLAAALSSGRSCSCAHEGFVCLDNRIVEYILALTEYEDKLFQVYEVPGGCNCKYAPETVVVTVNNAAFKMRKSACDYYGGKVLSDAKALHIDCGFDGYKVIN